MRISFMLLPMIPVIGLVLGGCATPPENASLVEARAQFSALQSVPESSTLAAIETKDAFTALNQADQLSIKDRTASGLEQLVYIAKQKIAIAEQTIAGREAEAALKNIDAERNQTRLDVRTEQLKALQATQAPASGKRAEERAK